jgi:hypothetical protein
MRKKKSDSPGKPLQMPNVATPPVARTVDVRTPVVQALEDPQYQWRTMDALVRISGLREQDVVDILRSMCDEIVRATTGDGRTVYTTRKHYQETHGFGAKLLSALADKVVA